MSDGFGAMPAAEPLVARYRAAGFVALGRILDEPGLEELRREEERLRSALGRSDCSRSRAIFLSNVCWKSEPARRFCQGGAHLDAVRRILGPDVLLMWTQFATKLPEAPGETSQFPWHQDCGYFDVTPCPLTVFTALDDTDADNGCLWVVPESHRGGLLPHGKEASDRGRLSATVGEDGIPLALSAGEAVAFTGYTLHRSLTNRTGRMRRAFLCQYAVPCAREEATSKPLLPERDLLMVSGNAPLR